MSKKILVIEDDEFVRENMEEILTEEGYNVAVAPDGEEGVSAANNFLPDLILCDISMRNLDGFGVLQRVQNNPRTLKIPFIFVTARAEVSDIKRGLSRGADDYLTKPFTREELLRVIKFRLGKYEVHSKDLDALRKSISYSLPHEFRTPLMGVVGFANIIKEDFDKLNKQEILEYLDHISFSANRLSELTGNFLLFTSLQVKKSEPAQAEYFKTLKLKSPATYIKNVGHEVAKIYKREDDLEIACGKWCDLFTSPSECDVKGEYPNKLPAEETSIPISEQYFIKILKEVIGNAFKFSRKKEKVSICFCTFNNHFSLSITNINHTTFKDQIPMNLPLIQFNRERFEQQGVGLGLAIVYEIITLTEGTINLKTDHGNFVALIKYPVIE